MDPNDKPLSSVDDDSCIESNSGSMQKSETDEESIHLRSDTDKKSNEKNDSCPEKRYETGPSIDVTKVKKRKIQNKSPKVKEDRSPVCPIHEDSEKDFSLLGGNEEKLKTSLSMISLTSTAATFGSSSSDGMSTDDELLDDTEETSEKSERQDFSKIDPSLNLPPADVENMFDSSTTSFDTDKANQPHAADGVSTGTAESSLQKDSNPLKSPEKCIDLETVDTRSSSKERRSNNFESSGFPLETQLSSTLSTFSVIEKSPTECTTTVPPLLKNSNSSIMKDEKVLDCGATGGFDAFNINMHNYCQKEDKSLRRKERTVPPTTSTESVSGNTRKVGNSSLGLAKSMESTSSRGNLYESCGRSLGVKYFASNSWITDIFAAYNKTENTDSTPKLDKESLLKEVRKFFQNNDVKADINLSRKENRRQIITSRYFSDEFSRSHGLLTYGELLNKWEQDCKSDAARVLSTQLKTLELCRELVENSISEEAFFEYVEIRYRNVEADTENIFEPSDRKCLNGLSYTKLYSIEEDIGFGTMLELYDELHGEGLSFNFLLEESQKCNVTELIPQSGEQPSTSENANRISNECLAGNRDIYDRTSFRDMSRNMGSTSSVGRLVPKIDESAAESSQKQSKEPKETSNVGLGLDSNVSNSSINPEDESCVEMSSLSPNAAAEKFKSSNEPSTDK